MNSRVKFIILFIICLLVFNSTSSLVNATQGVAVSPSRLDVSLTNGEQVTGSFTIANDTTNTVTFKAEAASLNIEGVNVPVTLNPTQIQLNAGAKGVINYTVGPASFYYYQPLKGQGKIGLTQQVTAGSSASALSSKLTVLVDVKLVYNLADIAVKNITISPTSPKEGEPVTFSAVVSNKATSTVSPDNCKDASLFNIKWYANGSLIYNTRINGIKAGEEITLTYKDLHGLKPSQTGIYDKPIETNIPVKSKARAKKIKFAAVRLDVDIDNEVDEDNETNNSMTSNIVLSVK